MFCNNMNAIGLAIASNLMFVISISNCYLHPYESETRETKSMNGLWHFKISPENDINIGFKDNWYSTDFQQLGDTIMMPVPASYNDITTNKTIRDHVGWVWYQRQFFIPSTWLPNDKRVFLHFGSVHYFAKIYLNGKEIGSHEGGHVPFQLELPWSALSSHNLLTLAVNNTLSLDTVPQGELSYPNDTAKYPKGYRLYKHDFDYFDYAGINRPVILFTTPKVYISEISVIPDVQKEMGLVHYNTTSSVEVELGAESESPCSVKLLDKSSQPVAQSASCRGTLIVHNAHLWWPIGTCHQTPGYLYTLEVTLNPNTVDADVYRLPVGIRTVSSTNNSVLINDKLVYLRGFGMHEDADIRGRGFDYAVMSRDMNLISWIGANIIRTSHYPYAEETLDRADALGILVIMEVPACSVKEFGEQLYLRHVTYLRKMVEVHRNRPSVFMWSLANEPQSSTVNASYYFGNLTMVARMLEPSRLITFVTSQSVHTDTAVQHVDVICINRYNAWYSDGGLTDLIPHQVSNEVSAWHTRYNRPVIMTEYGAGSISGLHTMPETMWTEDYQEVTYLEHFKAFDKLKQVNSLAGEMIWNFIDFKTQQGNHYTVVPLIGIHVNFFYNSLLDR